MLAHFSWELHPFCMRASVSPILGGLSHETARSALFPPRPGLLTAFAFLSPIPLCVLHITSWSSSSALVGVARPLCLLLLAQAKQRSAVMMAQYLYLKNCHLRRGSDVGLLWPRRCLSLGRRGGSYSSPNSWPVRKSEIQAALDPKADKQLPPQQT